MTWTAPRTWVDGELENATILNTHIRDNLSFLREVVIRKTADESVTNSITLQNDDHLTFSIAANEVWVVEGRMVWTPQSTAAGIKLGWSLPSGATGSWDGGYYTVASGAMTMFVTQAIANVLSSAQNSGADMPFLFWATIVNGANAGTAQLQWAQVTANATATILRANSFILGHRL